ncbi:hypothetical protein AHP1_611 [Aeromonas phage Ahp1_CNU-2021]|nr:hypothetical protein AHP1_611 [Aeromonas phage Ahp1_CNU-2021]
MNQPTQHPTQLPRTPVPVCETNTAYYCPHRPKTESDEPNTKPQIVLH